MIVSDEVTEELFLREQLLQKEMALEQEQIDKARLIKRLTEDFKKPVEQLIQFSNASLLRLQREEFQTSANYLAEIKMISEDLLMYLNDLQDLALLKTGDSKFCFTEIDIKSVLRSLQKKFRPIASSANVGLSFFMQPKGLYIRGDKNKLMKAISIVISHMIHDLKTGGEIKIEVKQDSDSVGIYIIDNIPYHFDKKALDQIYFKLDGPKSRRSVPGFNLSVCKELILGQKGSIHISSTDKESLVKITLPLSKDF